MVIIIHSDGYTESIYAYSMTLYMMTSSLDNVLAILLLMYDRTNREVLFIPWCLLVRFLDSILQNFNTQIFRMTYLCQ